MSLEKIWFNDVDRDHNFVVFNDNKIYRLKAKPDKLYSIKRELEAGIINEQFFALPVNYLHKVEYRVDDINLHLHYGNKTEDEIRISNTRIREEIFQYLKAKTKYVKSETLQPSLLKRIKKPLIALCVIIGLFIYVMSIVNGMNAGYQYELAGGRPGLGAIVLALANLGAQTNIIIFSVLSLIAGFRIFRNIKDNSEIHRLVYK